MQRGCNEGAMGMQRGCRGVQRGCSEDMQGGCSAVTVHRDVHRDAKDAEGPRLSLLPLEQLYSPWLYAPRLFFLPRLY